MGQELTLNNSGVLGPNQVIGVFVTSINNLGPGRWKVWGSCRHSLPDAIRLRIGSTAIITNIPAYANETVSFGPVYFDIFNRTDDVILDLMQATGVADSASGMLFAQRSSAL